MFLTIIVPVYNTAPWLKDCLESLLTQDIPDYEILCINDGSTVESPRILETYQNAHPRLRVLHQENAGVSAARERGLSAARGDYIWFVDSDDSVLPSCLSSLKAATIGADRLTLAGGSDDPDADAVLWRNLLRRSFMEKNSLHFSHPLHYGEDTVFLYEFRRCAPVRKHFDKQVYFHRIRQNSIVYNPSPEAAAKRMVSMATAVGVLANYHRQQGALAWEAENLKMKFLYLLLYQLAGLPKAEADAQLQQLRTQGLYPCNRPKGCTVTRCPEIRRQDVLGKLLHWVYCHSNRPWCFFLLRLWRRKSFVR